VGLDIWVEADKRLTEEALVAVLRECGATDIEAHEGEVQAIFPGSGMSMHGKDNEGRSGIKAEQPLNANFTVDRRCIFRLVTANYDLCIQELHRFLETVAADTGAFFVASFQLESTVFIHVGSGLQQCQ
jgi:hypothetical protein